MTQRTNPMKDLPIFHGVLPVYEVQVRLRLVASSLPLKPFAKDIGNYPCHDGSYEGSEIHDNTSSLLPVWSW